MFVYRSFAEKKGWEFITPGSIHWDSYHQEIYRNFRYNHCETREIKDLPPLPEVPDFKTISWHDNFQPEDPFNSADFPNIAQFLEKQPDHSLQIFFILHEDSYETVFGDGKFLYYDNKVFLSEKEAEAYAMKNTSHEKLGYRYYVRSFGIEIHGGTITSDDFEPELFEHYKMDYILLDLEALLANQNNVSLFKGIKKLFRFLLRS